MPEPTILSLGLVSRQGFHIYYTVTAFQVFFVIMYHSVPPERETSSTLSIQRLPSFRNFELPNLNFQRLASSRTLNRVYKESDDMERQELKSSDEEGLKWEQDYNAAAAEDPNLVCNLYQSFFPVCPSERKLIMYYRYHGMAKMIQPILKTGPTLKGGPQLSSSHPSHLFLHWHQLWLRQHLTPLQSSSE